MLHFEAVPGAVKDLLVRLAPSDALRDFSLGGGTSLALRFGHRISVDLDFFTTIEFLTDDLFENLGVSPGTVMGSAKNTLTIDAGGVKVDLLRHAYPALGTADVIQGISLISLPDLAAMKLNAIANRGSKKDFYDVVELLKHFSMEEMLGFFSNKYTRSDPFSVIRSLAWFEDAEIEPDPVSLRGLAWNEVKDRVCAAVSTL